MDKIVLIQGKNTYRLNTLNELVEILIDEQYYNLSKEQQIDVLKKEAFKCEIINRIKEGTINTQDEITYIFSLLKLNLITLMERKDADILSKYMDKTQMQGNYLILNTFADNLLDTYKAQENLK